MWVLTYHSISNGSPPLCIDAARFANQLDFLLEAGWAPIALSACVAEIEKGDGAATSALPRFAVTFDDGYRDFAEQALPVLEARGVPATLFSVATDERARLAGGIEGAALLAREELRELAQEGVEIAGHGIDHVDLTRLGDADIEREVRDGRARLSDWIGRDVEHFAYPFGAWNARVRSAVAREYRAAFTTQLGAVPTSADAHAIPRVDAFYLDDAGLRGAISAHKGESWLRARRWLRRVRGSEPRRAIPQRAASQRRAFTSPNSILREAARASRAGFGTQERYASWQ